MAIQQIQVRHWTRKEYDRLVESGFFQPGERLELVEGEIIQMSPQGAKHATAVRLVEEALRSVYSKGFDVRVQLPLALADDSEPEPDVAVVTGNPRDYRHEHPHTAVLICEIADTTVDFDQKQKGKLYAKAGIPEYWILNLAERYLEVYRTPQAGTYQDMLVVEATGSIAFNIGSEHKSLRIEDLLP